MFTYGTFLGYSCISTREKSREFVCLSGGAIIACAMGLIYNFITRHPSTNQTWVRQQPLMEV